MLWGIAQVSNPLKSMMQTFDGSRATCFPRWRRPRLFCNGGHIGGCVEFKTPGNGMLKLARVESFPILNEQYTTFPRLVAKDLAKAALPDVLVLIIGGALQLVQAANVFDNQGYVCAENDLKTAYLPWVWLPVLPVLTVN